MYQTFLLLFCWEFTRRFAYFLKGLKVCNSEHIQLKNYLSQFTTITKYHTSHLVLCNLEHKVSNINNEYEITINDKVKKIPKTSCKDFYWYFINHTPHISKLNSHWHIIPQFFRWRNREGIGNNWLSIMRPHFMNLKCPSQGQMVEHKILTTGPLWPSFFRT